MRNATLHATCTEPGRDPKARRTASRSNASAQRDASAQHEQAEAELKRLRRSGADARRRSGASSSDWRGAEPETARAADGHGARRSLRPSASCRSCCVRGRDPAAMVQALAATHPVLLMPVAVQTRYDDATTKPDDPHLPGRVARLHPRAQGSRRTRSRKASATGRSASPIPPMPRRRGRRSRACSAPRAPPTWCKRRRRPTSR